MIHTSRTRRGLAVLGAVAMAGLGVFGASSAAFATDDSPNPGNIVQQSGSIVIHKHEHQTTTPKTEAKPDGSSSISTPGVDGVTFTAYQLLKNGAVVDLTDTAAWNGLKNLGVSADCTTITGGTGYTKGAVVGTAVTEGGGLGTIDVSTIGAYIVCETAAPPTVTDQAAPFIVTVPFPYQGGWLYRVNVYPKNGTSTVEKSINAQDPNGVALGATVQFPVTVKVPALAEGRDFTGFDVVDTLDSRLTPTPASGGVGPGVLSVTLGGSAVDAARYTVSANGNKVTVAFKTDVATQALLKGAANQSVVVTFQGTVERLGDGVIKNTATGFVNNPSHDNGIVSNEVKTNWGDLKLHKVDRAAPATSSLAGAKFQVYAAADPYQAGDCSAAQKTGAPLSVGGQTTFTSTGTGLVQIDGLFVSDSVNAPINAAQRCYVVVETEAPAGFVTPTGAAAEHGVAVRTGSTASGSYDLTVENVQQDVPNLPLTGAAGQVLMVAGGVALVLVAGGIAVMSRRRAAQR